MPVELFKVNTEDRTNYFANGRENLEIVIKLIFCYVMTLRTEE